MKKQLFSLFALVLLLGASAQQATLTIESKPGAPTISKHIYGHFSEHLGHCVYGGLWVDEDLNVPKEDRLRLDVVDALKKIKIPNLRWPGGCFADEYHWKEGIGPREDRPSMLNTHWGMLVEDNSFGTHEFLKLCELIGAEPYLAGNVGSGTVEELNDWIEYCNYEGETTLTKMRKANGQVEPWRVKYWGIGNESWGCGGNMTAEYFSGLYKQYATYARNYPDSPIRRIASGANSADYSWTETLMKNVPKWMMWGISVHYYTLPTGNWGHKGSATDFSEEEYFNTMKNCLFVNELLDKHIAIMDRYDPENRVALVLDEWGIWTDPEPNSSVLYQQNSLRDALVAGTTLNSINNRAERVRMANLAQTVNVLQALILTDEEKMLLTPTYHVFDLYKVHQDAKLMPFVINSPEYKVGDKTLDAVNVSASQDENGVIHITLVNIDAKNSIKVNTAVNNVKWSAVTGKILTSAKITDVNTFDNPNHVVIGEFKGAKKSKGNLEVNLPAKSIVMLELK